MSLRGSLPYRGGRGERSIMMKEIKLGDYNTLKIKELARREGYGEVFGLYLDGGREGEILMPQK